MKRLTNGDLAVIILLGDISLSKEMTEADRFVYFHKLRTWDKIMTRKIYRIELKIDFNDDELHEHMLAVAKQYARDFISSAMLLSDRGKPDIALITDDSFVGREDIELIEPSDNVHA